MSNSLPYTIPPRPMKQKMAASFKSLVSSLVGAPKPTTAPIEDLFPKTNPEVDGEGCLHDCQSCTAKYPRSFKIDEEDQLYGEVKGWSTHLLVATGKGDWVRDVCDEKGSVMEAVGRADAPANGKLMLSASNIPTPNDTSDYSEPTTGLLLPSFTVVHNLTPGAVPSLISGIVSQAPTTSSPLGAEVALPTTLGDLTLTKCPHNVVILLCSQKTRDARCGQSAPILRKELERHLRPLGLYRDLHDERPGGVGIYFISHVGGHKYSANVMVYRRPNPFGQDELSPGETNGNGEEKKKEEDVGAAQGIWLARVKPEDCENLVRYTVLRGKLVKPESQLRGGFDRSKGLMSW